MTERQTEAYLLARDTVRRIQRTSSIVEAIAQRPHWQAGATRSDRRQSH
jgi:hypothetical protein